MGTCIKAVFDVRKVIISLALMIGTLLLIPNMIGNRRGHSYIAAKIVNTERADVFQTIGLEGQISFADERYILSTSTGLIRDICIEDGRRVARGEALVRFDSDRQERAASVAAAELADISLNIVNDLEMPMILLEQTVQRAETDCTIRQILIKENEQVLAGTPLFRVSGTEQQIRCVASPADAANIVPGMWAWVSRDGERIGYAMVEMTEKYVTDTGLGQIAYLISLKPSQNLGFEEGEDVQVDIYVNGSNDVVSLPLEAITNRDTVWWINNEGICTEIPARIVLCDEKRAWVDLPEGIRVAVGEYSEGQMVAEACR